MVQIHLGNVSLKSTQRYTHVIQAEVASEVRDRLNYAFRLEEEIEEINGRAPEQSGRGGTRLKKRVYIVSFQAPPLFPNFEEDCFAGIKRDS